MAYGLRLPSILYHAGADQAAAVRVPYRVATLRARPLLLGCARQRRGPDALLHAPAQQPRRIGVARQDLGRRRFQVIKPGDRSLAVLLGRLLGSAAEWARQRFQPLNDVVD
jgi:hypothetical protein